MGVDPSGDVMAPTERNPVRLVVDGAIATIMLDRPPVNAMSARMQASLKHTALTATHREDIRAVVVRGAHGKFSAGGDIREMAAMTHQAMAEQSLRLQAAVRAVARIPKPVVAAIEGYALGGGCELALAADYRVAASDSRIGLPEIKLGVIPGAGGTQRLMRLVGVASAKDLIYTGRDVSADEALTLGIVNRVVPPSDVFNTAVEWAAQFATGPALALAAAKKAIDGGADLDAGLDLESSLFASLFATEDREIGMASFLENGSGKARFVGR